jgi:hypothetical protein
MLSIVTITEAECEVFDSFTRLGIESVFLLSSWCFIGMAPFIVFSGVKMVSSGFFLVVAAGVYYLCGIGVVYYYFI